MASSPHPRPRRPLWRDLAGALGTIVVVVLALLGLAVVGYVVLLAVAMNNYGSNK